MNGSADAALLGALAADQRGVFSAADLRTVLAARHPTSFARRVRRLLEQGTLRRFVRGWYVTAGFDLATLSQRLASRSCVSFGTVLADALLIGPQPRQSVMATKVGPARTYGGLGHEVVHLSLAEHLDFGWELRDGVRYASPEKAVLDSLYFHLRRRRYVFDIYSDIDVERLDRALLSDYLSRYRNPRFVRFAQELLELP